MNVSTVCNVLCRVDGPEDHRVAGSSGASLTPCLLPGASRRCTQFRLCIDEVTTQQLRPKQCEGNSGNCLGMVLRESVVQVHHTH